MAQSWCVVSEELMELLEWRFVFPKHDQKRLSSNDQLLQGHLSPEKVTAMGPKEVTLKNLGVMFNKCFSASYQLGGIFRTPYHPLKANNDIQTKKHRTLLTSNQSNK